MLIESLLTLAHPQASRHQTGFGRSSCPGSLFLRRLAVPDTHAARVLLKRSLALFFVLGRLKRGGGLEFSSQLLPVLVERSSLVGI